MLTVKGPISMLSLFFIYLLCASMMDRIKILGEIYHYIPSHYVSHCTRRLNATHQIGCSSRSGGSSGIVRFVNNTEDLVSFILRTDQHPETVLVMDYDLFTNSSLMDVVRLNSTFVAGMLVFFPIDDSRQATLPFSESSTCPNALYGLYSIEQQCNVTPAWNSYGTDYSSLDWPFPIALIQTNDSRVKFDLLDCYQKFNVNPVDDTRCAVEIYNFMSAVGSSDKCVRRQQLMSLQIFESPLIYCDELTGLNIVLGATNTTVAPQPATLNQSIERSANSSILILTRLDSRSMFERSGFASTGTLASAAVLISVAVHLMKQPAFKTLDLKRDVFFVFLDNEAYDFLGSRRLNYDLHTQALARYTKFPLKWDHVGSMIEVGEIGLPIGESTPRYFMLSDRNIYMQTKQPTDDLIEKLLAASQRFNETTFVRPSETNSLLPPTASIQSLLSDAPHPKPHLVLTDHAGPPLRNKHFESFLDTQWPPEDDMNADRSLLAFANTFSDAIHRIATTDATPLSEVITYPTPGDLMDCFVNNPNCTLLKLFLNPADVDFFVSLGAPIPAQSYLPLNKRELKLSHIVNVLLMGLTGDRTETANCPVEDVDKEASVYLMGYYNGSEQCYRTLLDLSSKFFFMSDNAVVPPAWTRSRLVFGSQYVRWYRTASAAVDGFSVAVGLLLILLTGCCALFLRDKLNIQISVPQPTNNETENTVAHPIIS
ncbi:Ubiquitin carboxyl-terminal hydrolase isozyme L5 [Paragonimus heterotremus]|uniref:Nicastrin n=1 Tax=Paragonimus heterotremus TaxID=100268 RepID=A0A8J4THT0_9TREM|nr:Ubiquitin carboxyl-terminal hydrolase isozyme L5 [Paragonimus heterotremus]